MLRTCGARAVVRHGCSVPDADVRDVGIDCVRRGLRPACLPARRLVVLQDTIATISAVQRRHGITATSLLNYVVSECSVPHAAADRPRDRLYPSGSLTWGLQRSTAGYGACSPRPAAGATMGGCSPHGPSASSLSPTGDGTTLIATRFVSPDSEGPASLYYAEGATFARAPPPPVPQPAPQQTQGQPGCTPCNGAASSGSSITQESSYELSFAAQGPAVVFVASEPITGAVSTSGGLGRRRYLCDWLVWPTCRLIRPVLLETRP